MCRRSVEGQRVLLGSEHLSQFGAGWQVGQLLNQQCGDATVDSGPLSLREVVARYRVVSSPSRTVIGVVGEDGVAVGIGRCNEGIVVDGHTRHGLQLLDAGIDTHEVGSRTSHLIVHIRLVGQFVLSRCGGGEQAVDGLEDIKQRTTDNGVRRVLCGLLVEGQRVLL